MRRITTILVAALVLGGCGEGGRHADVERWPQGGSAYNFNEPDAAFELHEDLEEISGLAVMDDGRLAAVQDEDGILYVLDPESGRIVEEKEFGDAGDYEAVAFGGGYLLVLESDGTLHRFSGWETDSLQGDHVQLDLPGRCDAEGLRFDERGNRLLVACKGEPGPDLEQARALYAFDLEGEPMGSGPAYVLDAKSFSVSVEDHPVNEAVRSVLSERVDLSGLRPSDIAIHPHTGEIFVLSSVREAVIAMTREGEVSSVWKLPDSLVDQPEGFDFMPNGDLFLSSEAGDKKYGVLLRFRLREVQPSSAE